ncbi:MAG TPA: hypothetical protein VL242_39060 [Sorangium sp.]|nr:hypothetical protein [Sorangium sp.]
MRLVAQSMWICLMLGVAIGFAPPIRAEDRAPAPGRSDGSAFKDHLRRAKRARAQGRWAEAAGAYEAAFEAAHPASATARERAEIAGELGLLGTGLVVASGVLGAATIASFFTDFGLGQAEPRRDNVALSPMAAPGQIGLVAHGVW